MKKEKLFLFIAIGAFVVSILVLIVLLVNSGDDERDDQTEDPPAGIERPTRPADSELSGAITFNWWGDEEFNQATRAVAELFMDLNPDVVIHMEYSLENNWQADMTDGLEIGAVADLMQVNFDWLTIYSPLGDVFMDLEDAQIANYLDLSNWNSQYIDMMRRDGVVQGIPVGMTARVPLMRTDIYEAAGLDVQDINTWENLIDAGRAIQEYHGNDVFALSPLEPQVMAYMMFSYIEQLTGRPFVDENFQFDYTLEELERGFQLIQNFMDNGVMPSWYATTDPLWIEDDWGGVSEWDSSISRWINGLENGEEVLEIRPHFTMDGALSTGWMSRPSTIFAISAEAEYPEVVAAFLNFMLTDEEAIEIMGTHHGVPLNSIGRSHFDALALEGLAVEASAIHANAETTIMNPIFEFPEVREVYESQLLAIFYGITTVEEAAAFVYSHMQGIIDAFVVR